MSSRQKLRVVLIGKTGVGKSSLGNVLLGRDAFRTEHCFDSVTFRCQWEDAVRDATHLEVTDTPGLSDTKHKQDKILREVGKSIAVAAPGPHVVLMVVRCDERFTEVEHAAYKTLKKLFGEDFRFYLIIVFTRGDTMECSREERRNKLDRMIHRAPMTLREVIGDAEGRYCCVSNKATGSERDEEASIVLTAMKDLVSRNDNGYFKSTLGEIMSKQVETVVQRHQQNESREEAERDARKDIVEDRAGSGFFTSLMRVVTERVLPVILPVAAHLAAGVAMRGGCSVM